MQKRKLTNRMVDLVKSEAARCQAQSRAQIKFAEDYAEVAAALEEAAAALKEKLEAPDYASRR